MMRNPLAKTPFLFLLLPLIVGILLQYYFKFLFPALIFFLLGLLFIIASFITEYKKRFRFRWFFGAGVFLGCISVGIFSTKICADNYSFVFNDKPQIYKGVIVDIPQAKPRTVACKVDLPDYGKHVICYLQPDSNVDVLKPGDVFLFESVIKPFKNMGDPDDFNYVRYMNNLGYAGSAYIPSGSLMVTGDVYSSLKIKALRIRCGIIDFYKSLGFNETQYTILSALTLGYQDALPKVLKQSFRATGTAHVLSVSGLHVGIIYAIINFFLAFIKKSSPFYWLKPVIIIILLWGYTFITGLPPSVIRASLMFTVFCLSEIVGRKTFSLNGLYISAFFMLLVYPLWLFDVSFQLSMVSVLAILCLLPGTVRLLHVENRVLRHVWQLSALSIVAQLGSFPLCLYYFGTFPTYFFISNLLVVPLVSCITYAVIGIVAAKLLTFFIPGFGYYIFYVPVKVLQILVDTLTAIIHFFENLPLAVIRDVRISSLNLFLLMALIVAVLAFFIRRNNRFLITALILLLVMLILRLQHNLAG